MSLNEINIIQLDEHLTNCTICNVDTLLAYYLPMYEGKVVDVMETDEWAGMPVCRQCYKDQTE